MIASLKIGLFQWLPSPLKAVNLLPDKKRRSFPQSQPWKLNVFQKIDSGIRKKSKGIKLNKQLYALRLVSRCG